LAEKLKLPTKTGQQAHWLGVSIAGTSYLIALTQAGEIFPYAPLRKVPYTKTWFLGVVNLLGVLCGAIDLHGFMHSELAEGVPATIPTPEQRLLGFQTAANLNAVIHLDRLLGLKTKDMLTPYHPTAPLHPLPNKVEHPIVRQQWIDSRKEIWLEIDLDLLSKHEAFLSIAN
jgi:twitching motility protein PilI